MAADPPRIPAALWLVESFLNAVDVDTGKDDFDSLPRLRRWLADHRQPEAAVSATADDLALALAVRTELREEVRSHHTPDGTDRDRTKLDALAAAIGLRTRWQADGVALGPSGTGVTATLGEILAAVALADHDGTWRRLKLCPADDCQRVYYDKSKNASRRWCSMTVCGNRSKTRAYRHRQRGAPQHPAPDTVSAVAAAARRQG